MRGQKSVRVQMQIRSPVSCRVEVRPQSPSVRMGRGEGQRMISERTSARTRQSREECRGITGKPPSSRFIQQHNQAVRASLDR
eukprot:760838-Hanusia_phi.AAC.1